MRKFCKPCCWNNPPAGCGERYHDVAVCPGWSVYRMDTSRRPGWKYLFAVARLKGGW